MMPSQEDEESLSSVDSLKDIDRRLRKNKKNPCSTSKRLMKKRQRIRKTDFMIETDDEEEESSLLESDVKSASNGADAAGDFLDEIEKMTNEKEKRMRALASLKESHQKEMEMKKKEEEKMMENFKQIDKQAHNEEKEDNWMPVGMLTFFTDEKLRPATSRQMPWLPLSLDENLAFDNIWNRVRADIVGENNVMAILEARIIPRICIEKELDCPEDLCLWFVEMIVRGHTDEGNAALLNIMSLLSRDVNPFFELTTFHKKLQRSGDKPVPVAWLPKCKFFLELLSWSGLREDSKGEWIFLETSSLCQFPTVLQGSLERVCGSIGRILRLIDICFTEGWCHFDDENNSSCSRLLQLLCLVSIDASTMQGKLLIPSRPLEAFLEWLPESIWESVVSDAFPRVFNRLNEKMDESEFLEKWFERDLEEEEVLNKSRAFLDIVKRLPSNRGKCLKFKLKLHLFWVRHPTVKGRVPILKEFLSNETAEETLDESVRAVFEQSAGDSFEEVLLMSRVLAQVSADMLSEPRRRGAEGDGELVSTTKGKPMKKKRDVNGLLCRSLALVLQFLFELMQVLEAEPGRARKEKNEIFENLDCIQRSLPLSDRALIAYVQKVVMQTMRMFKYFQKVTQKLGGGTENQSKVSKFFTKKKS